MNTLTYLVLLCCFLCTLAHTNYRPIIGILAQELNPKHGDTYITANYFEYVQMAGARGVPIRVKMPIEYYRSMFKSVNGLLFPGGGVDLLTSEFAKAAQILFKMALESNEAGDYFPVWGTCLGFQLLTALVSNKNLMSTFDAEDLALPLEFEPDFRNSRIFGALPDDVYRYLKTLNVTENFHQYGLTPKTYDETIELRKFFKLLSTNKDRNGKQFVSTVEAYDYPVYGTQWHPEKNMFTWQLSYNVTHTPEAIRVSQHMANFLVAEARKSNHTFPSLEEEIDALIYNYNPVYSKDSHFTQNYYFNYTSDEPSIVIS